MSKADRAKIEKVAKAICRERCAFYGEPPCFDLGEEYVPQEWQPEACNEPGCTALAMAAIVAMQAAVDETLATRLQDSK